VHPLLAFISSSVAELSITSGNGDASGAIGSDMGMLRNDNTGASSPLCLTFIDGVATMKVSQWWRRLDLAEAESSKYRALRREVVEKYLGFWDLSLTLLYAKAGSQDCPSRKVQIRSVSNKP
jgi:hypothetical protein